ncbi:unnamed protein product [Anisakis simplex]|uniref:BAH domain-containing protein n=1 Tax=Anisakis simplex TaxID=6269 RepID=A0A0M3J8P5_ANISI|nr:unnamed protein product [Anisakis simplex]
MFVRADECFEKPDHQRVIYCELKEIYDVDDTMRYNVDVLWRLTRSCHAVGNTYEAKDQKRKEILLEGSRFAYPQTDFDHKTE